MPIGAEGVTEVVERVRVRVLPDGRMTREDAARYLGHASKTLAQWQIMGKGPRSVLVGGRRFYFKEELDAFIRSAAASPGRRMWRVTIRTSPIPCSIDDSAGNGPSRNGAGGKQSRTRLS